MWADHHYFSRLIRLAGIAGVWLFVAGCAGSPGLSPLADSSKNVKKSTPAQIVKPTASTVDAKPEPIKNKAHIEKASARYVPQRKSDWCNYLAEDAASDATILRAPTVYGQVTYNGRNQAGISYDVMDAYKANLIEKNARAKCRQFTASRSLNEIAKQAGRLQTRSGFAAKAASIRSQKRKLNALRLLVRRELMAGNIDRAQAAKLTVSIAKIKADGELAGAESKRRGGNLAFDQTSINQLARQLVAAEQDIEKIKSDLRTASAMSVNLEGGWRQGLTNAGTIIQNDAFFGGVKFSVKLGAFNPKRWKHENAAVRAKVRALRNEPGSIFWRLEEISRTHRVARSGLSHSLTSLVLARRAAQKLKRNLPAGDPAFVMQRYSTEIEIIELDADIAATRASLAQLDRNLTRLRQLGS